MSDKPVSTPAPQGAKVVSSPDGKNHAVVGKNGQVHRTFNNPVEARALAGLLDLVNPPDETEVAPVTKNGGGSGPVPDAHARPRSLERMSPSGPPATANRPGWCEKVEKK
jgi:hypothetical protein